VIGQNRNEQKNQQASRKRHQRRHKFDRPNLTTGFVDPLNDDVSGFMIGC
jgi:hypothetical protein